MPRIDAIKRSAIRAFTSQFDVSARMEELGTLRHDEERVTFVRAFDRP